MTLQSSGAISLLDLQNEYGGSSPISLSEYYRNGAYVPNSISSAVREPSSGDYYDVNNYYWATFEGTNNTLLIVWNGTAVYQAVDPILNATSYTTGGYTYYRSSFRETVLGKFFNTSNYGIYRTYSSTILVNQNVPTSGQISLSNFYGGRKT